MENSLDDVIESTIVHNFGVVAAIDDFSPNGKLSYTPPQVDGVLTDYNEIPLIIQTIAEEIKKASAKRDELKSSNV